MTSTAPQLLDAAAVAARLCVTKDRAYRLMASGDIAVTRIGKATVRVTEEALAEFIASRTAAPRRSRTGAAS